jgi:hypothetical protein
VVKASSARVARTFGVGDDYRTRLAIGNQRDIRLDWHDAGDRQQRDGCKHIA